MKVISVASQKGGVGKSTTAIALAAGLARLKKKRGLLIDIDSQANVSKVLLDNYPQYRRDDTICRTILDRKPFKIHPSKISNLDLVISHILLSNADVELTTAIDHREARLQRVLDQVKDKYDFVLIDCPPALGWLTINAFVASDQVLVVVSPGYFELDSIVQIGNTIQEVQKNFNPTLSLLGFLFTMSDSTVNARTSLQILRQTYTDDVLKTVVPRNTDIRDAHFQKQDIFQYNPKATSAQAYKKLIDEIFV